MNDFSSYLELIVEPMFEDFVKNPRSERHAFLACVAIYHAIDRAAYPAGPGNLKKKWRQKSLEFGIIDMIAHHFKHVVSDDERYVSNVPGIPLSATVFGKTNSSESTFNDLSICLHNLHFVLQNTIKFLHTRKS